MELRPGGAKVRAEVGLSSQGTPMWVRKDYCPYAERPGCRGLSTVQTSRDKQGRVTPRSAPRPAPAGPAFPLGERLPGSAWVLRSGLPLVLTGPWTLC